MTRALLTSTGFDNKNLADAFLNAMHKNPKDIRVLFIPTAAFGEGKESIKMIPNFMNDLTDICKIPNENITTYNLIDDFNEDILSYDAIYFTGGDEKYLVRKIFKCHFNLELTVASKKDIFIIGVSAGAVIFSNYPDNIALPLIPNYLDVHYPKDKSTPDGNLPDKDIPIYLNDDQGILILDDYMQIIS